MIKDVPTEEIPKLKGKEEFIKMNTACDANFLSQIYDDLKIKII